MSHRLFKTKFNAEPYSALGLQRLQNSSTSTTSSAAPRTIPRQTLIRASARLGRSSSTGSRRRSSSTSPPSSSVHYPLPPLSRPSSPALAYTLSCRSTKTPFRWSSPAHVHKWNDYGLAYGPRHYTMAATRYDANAYMLLEVDTKQANNTLPQSRSGRVVYALQQALLLPLIATFYSSQPVLSFRTLLYDFAMPLSLLCLRRRVRDPGQCPPLCPMLRQATAL